MWILRRGFDWTDEAFVTRRTATHWKVAGEPWGFRHLLHPLDIVTGQSVLALRILRLLGYLLLSVCLVWSARAVLRRTRVSIPRSGWVFILLMAQAGTFFAWSYPPQYLGYNELASWFAQSGVALNLLSLAILVTFIGAAGLIGLAILDARRVAARRPATTRSLSAFNHSGHVNPWVGRKCPAAFRSLTVAYSTHKPADLFVLQPGTSTRGAPSTSVVTKTLAACGIAIPGDFRAVERRDSADPERAMTIWRLKSR